MPVSLKITLDVTTFESPDRTYPVSRYFSLFRHADDGFACNTNQFPCLILKQPFVGIELDEEYG